MKQKIGNNAKVTVTIVRNGVPKMVEVDSNLGEMLEKAYADSNVYGLGGSTARKLNDFFRKQIAEFKKLMEDEPERSKAAAFAEAFLIYSNQSPLLLEALQWVEKHSADEGFTSRYISMDNFLSEDVLGWRLERSSEPYPQLVTDFSEWAGKTLIDANLGVSFVRFVKFFYTLIK